MWILISFGVFIIFLTIVVVVVYYLTAKKYYWLQGNPSEKERTKGRRGNTGTKT